MSIASFENKLYGGFLRDYSDILKSLYCRMAIAILHDDKEAMKTFILDAMHVQEKGGSILPRDGLYYKASNSFIQKAKKIIGFGPKDPNFTKRLRYINDNQVEQLLNLRLKEDEKGQNAFLKTIITISADFAASCKYISRSENLPKTYEKELNKHAIVDFLEAKRRALTAGDIRNEYLGHDSELNLSRLDNATCMQALESLLKAGESFDDFNKEDVKEAKLRITKEFNKYKNKLNASPISKEDMEKAIENFSIETFKSLHFIKEYDEENDTLYTHSMDDVKREFKKYYVDTSAASQELLNKVRDAEIELEKTTEDLKNERFQNKEIKSIVDVFSTLIVDAAIPRIIDKINEESIKSEENALFTNKEYRLDSDCNDKAICHEDNIKREINGSAQAISRPKSIKRVLPQMSSYKGGPVMTDQLEELAKNTVIMADADFWMKKENVDFLARKYNSLMKKHGRKLLIDWNTRVELFKYERNTTGNGTNEQINNAKYAHHIMHLMVAKGYASYLPATSEICSSDYSITRIIKENPSLLFTVFSNSADFAERIVHEGLDNVVPVSYIATSNTCIVKKALKESIKDIFSADNEVEIAPVNEEKAQKEGDKKQLGESGILQPDSEKTREKQNRSNQNITSNPTKNRNKSTEISTVTAPAVSFDSYTVIKEGDDLLPLDQIASEGDTLTDKSGEKIVIGRLLGKGGEGSVYECNLPGKAIKIYHRERLTSVKLSKLELMISIPPKSTKICWPERILYNTQGQFVGYLMKSADGYKEFGVTVLKLNSQTVANNSMKGWDRLALVELCVDLCRTFKKMHDKGILMGDVNYRNMLLNNNDPNNHTDYMFVDCDSYQIQGYPCPVGTMVFTSPKTYERNNVDPSALNFGTFLRTLEDENYAVASLLFHILMLNQSPFAKKNGAENIEEAIRNYDFAYRLKDDKENTGVDVPDGAFRMIWNNMPNSVKELFGAVFKRAEDVSVERWIEALSNYKYLIEQGRYTRDLTPKLYLDISGDFTVKFKCDACGEERNMPKERYNRVKPPYLCNDCLSIRAMMIETPVAKECRRCGMTFEVNRWDEWMASKGFRKRRTLCRNCIEYYKSRGR